MSHNSLSPRFMLPIMIFVGVLIVGVRLGDVWETATNGSLLPTVTQAQAEDSQQMPPTDAHSSTSTDKEEMHAKAAENDDESDTPESALYRQLAGRRDQLDKRAKELDAREALSNIAEKRIEQKITEMESLRKQIETLLGQANAAQATQIENLVKIYEIMKPKEAARIFETLEMPVLLGVIKRMKPARTAPIMAEMNPQRAKQITTELTHQNELPSLK